jgi:hypothetical protein
MTMATFDRGVETTPHRGRRFLIWRTHNPPGTVPSSISIIGGGDRPGVWPMHYFDERGVYRVYQLSVRADGFDLWRDEPGFRQRGTGTFDEGGSAMRVLFELNTDGTFKRDLELTYRRRAPKT